MRISKSGLAFVGAAALLSSLRVVAADATAQAPAGQLEEITVTAEKRAETQQDVPLSMTTFGAAALSKRPSTPSSITPRKCRIWRSRPPATASAPRARSRFAAYRATTSTGYYMDDTPLPDSLDPRILDIDHIEVLRGPQGTLYGARSMGGLVRIVTQEPDLEQIRRRGPRRPIVHRTHRPGELDR